MAISWGGVEKVTEKVIDAANSLRAMAVPAIGYDVFIPAWRYALQKGIPICYAPDGPTQEVAEWALTAALMMNRRFLEAGKVGSEKFLVTKGIENQRVGILGLGRIGTRVSEMLKVFQPASISYYSHTRKEAKEQRLGLKYLELEELLKQSDILFIFLPDEAHGFFDAGKIALIKNNALVVNITHPGIIDEGALYSRLVSRQIRAISDYPMKDEFDSIPYSNWYSMNTSNTVTDAGAKLMSDMVTKSLLNLLETGQDKYQIEL